MISVLGCDGSVLPEAARARLAAATLVAGAERHLAAAPVPAGVPTIVMGDVGEAVRAVVGHDGPAVVLASGDPGLFGVLRRLRAAGAEPEVHPAVSSVALAFARAGLSWDDALVTSAHGRDLRRAAAACRAHPKVAVLTAPGAGPAELGAALAGVRRRLFVAEDLGSAQERCTWLTPTQAGTWPGWSELNVVLCVDEQWSTAMRPGWLAGRESPGAWALADDAFAHRDGMLTKTEVRAFVLARLGPRLGDLVWDIGAGSGAVGIECARLGAAVVAVEQDDTGALEQNVAAHGVDLQMVRGTAPGVLVGLPDPDAVFVGGGGPEVVAAVVARDPARVVVALATLERVGPTLAALQGYDTQTVLLQAQRLQPLADGHRLVPTNPVFVVSGTRRRSAPR